MKENKENEKDKKNEAEAIPDAEVKLLTRDIPDWKVFEADAPWHVPAYEKPLQDGAKLAEINRIYNEVHPFLLQQKESEAALELGDLLKKISRNISKYDKDKEDKSYLDEAIEAARLAKIKANTFHRGRTQSWIKNQMVLFIVLVAIAWAVLRVIFHFFFTFGVFYLDAFNIAWLGAMVSSIVYLGKTIEFEGASAVSTFADLIASPFVAVVLIVLFTELGINIGSEAAAAGANSEIITFTLKEASNALKLGFAFMFGFFGEISIEVLKGLMKSITGRE